MLADELQVQEDLVAEIDAHRNEQDNYLARKDTLLHFVILEALRLQPVLPFTFPEEATVDKVLSGFLVPKGVRGSSPANGRSSHADTFTDDCHFRHARNQRPQSILGCRQHPVPPNALQGDFAK